MTATALPLTISEADFQRTVIDTALLYQWRVHHSRPAMTRAGRWVTPISGHPGLPDLVLARDGVVLLAELKRFRGRPSPDQRLWLAALGGHGRLWSPDMWLDEILPTLSGSAFRVLPSGEALIVHHRRPGSGGADPKETRE